MNLRDDEDEGEGETELLLSIVVLDVVCRKNVVAKVDPRQEQVKGSLFGLFSRASLGGLNGPVFFGIDEVLLVWSLTAELLQKILGV